MYEDEKTYRVIAEVRKGHRLVGDRWEPTFMPVTIATGLDYDRACAAAIEFRRADPTGEGRNWLATRLEAEL